MVARNAWTSNLRPFLGVRTRREGFRVLGGVRSIGVWRAIFAETLDSRGGDIGTPQLLVQRDYNAAPPEISRRWPECSQLLKLCNCLPACELRGPGGFWLRRIQFRLRPRRGGRMARSLSGGPPGLAGASRALLAGVVGLVAPGVDTAPPLSSWRTTLRRELWTCKLSPTS